MKIAFIKERKHVPQIGSFTMFEMPTGNADKGLGVGKVWYKLPIWLQKNIGKWPLDGGARLPGGAANRVSQLSLRRIAGEDEPQRQARTWCGGVRAWRGRSRAPQTEASTLIDLGGYYHFKHNPGQQFLFCYGHSVAGQTENYAYVACTGRGEKTRTTSRKA